MNIKALVEKFKNLDSIGILSLIRWAFLVLAIIMIIPCEFVGGSALVVCSILLWVFVITFLVLSIVVAIKKKNAKRNKSY